MVQSLMPRASRQYAMDELVSESGGQRKAAGSGRASEMRRVSRWSVGRSMLFLVAQSLQIYFVMPLQQQAINCRKLSHQTHAEALHIELALMAAPVGGFGQLPARY